MYREMWQHKRAYAVLIVGLVILTILFFAVWPNHWLQRLVALLIGLFYAAWGIMTHVQAERLSNRIIYEYAGVSLLATVILFLVTL